MLFTYFVGEKREDPLLDRAWEFNKAQANLGSIFVPDKIVFDALEW